MLTDYDSLFEKFSILTIDGHITDKRAFEIVKKLTTTELYNRLQQEVLELELGR